MKSTDTDESEEIVLKSAWIKDLLLLQNTSTWKMKKICY